MLLSLGLMGQALVPLGETEVMWGREGSREVGRMAGKASMPNVVQACLLHSTSLQGHLTINLCPKHDLAGPGPHLRLCSRCPQGCWNSCGPLWKTLRTPHQGYSLYSPCPRLSQHPLGSGDPGRKERGPKVVAHGFLGHYG